jgi:hypothetical protein
MSRWCAQQCEWAGAARAGAREHGEILLQPDAAVVTAVQGVLSDQGY